MVSSNWCYHFRCVWPGIPKLPKITSLLFVCNILRKKWVMKLIFCMQISMKACYILILWFWWERSSIFKIFKVTSLQYLYNISKKKSGMEFIFCMQINVKVSTSWHYRFWWKWPDMSKVPKIGSWWCFSNISEKSVVTAFVFYCDAKHSDIYGVQSFRCYLLFLHGLD